MKSSRLSLLLLLPLAGCATAGLAEGEYLMQKSNLLMENTEGLTVADINPYIRSAEKYSKSVVAQTEENIESHLNYLGYYHPTIESETRFNNKKAQSTYYVKPGGRTVIDSVFYHVPQSEEFSEAFQTTLPGTVATPGAYLSEKSLDEERARSTSILRDAGFYDISKNNYSFIADTVSSPGRVKLHYNIKTESDPVKYRIGYINVMIPEEIQFSGKLVRDLLTLKTGDYYSEKKTNVTYNRLSSLRSFNTVNIEMSPSDSAIVDCDIIMNAGKQHGMKINLEASTNSNGLIGISPQITYYHKNIFHGGEWLDVGFKGNYQFRFNDDTRATETGLSATLSLPRFVGISPSKFKGDIPRTDISLSAAYQDRPEYNRFTTSVKYSYTGKFNKQFKTFVTYNLSPLKVNVVRIFRMSDDFFNTIIENPMLWYTYSDHLDAGVTGFIRFSSSKEIVPKTDYQFITVGASLSGNLLSLFNQLMPLNDLEERTICGVPYSQYARIDVNMGKSWRLGEREKTALATRFTFGIGGAYGNSSAMPYEEQFYCGGANSMRAWQARSLGPGGEKMYDTFVIPSQSGDIKLELDAEYRFPIVWKIEGAVFAETGNVWTIADYEEDYTGGFHFNDFYKYLAVDWGLGIRLNIDFLVIRVDGGFKVREPSRESPWLTPGQWFQKDGFAVHFGVGYPF